MGLPLAQSAGFWFPDQASDVAAGHDFTFFLILGVCAVFFFLITGASAWFVLKYRKRAGHKEQATSTHNTTLEIAWSAIPTVLLMVFFGVSTYWYWHMVNPPMNEKSLDVAVEGRKWKWWFEYKGEPFKSPARVADLYVVKDTPVRLSMVSPDVIHSFFVPAFRVKQDVVPGRINRLWFKPTQVGTFRLYCTEYCGQDHSEMTAWVHVFETEAEMVQAVIKAADTKSIPPEELGPRLYAENCASCHSKDGKAGLGPTFKGLLGSQREFEGGTTATADEAYVRESLSDPKAKVVKGFNPVMPEFKQLQAHEVDALILYLKSLK
ncbi:MAG: cytochrome c oxidase subunit II [Planctomycetes bacterium]|nr:cytochrome c oxidase subunit II [Planctomycetota bacterium]